MVEPERMPLVVRSCEAAVRKTGEATAGRGGGAGRTAGAITSRGVGTEDLGGAADREGAVKPGAAVGFAFAADEPADEPADFEVAQGGSSSKSEALTGLGGAAGAAGGAGGAAGFGGGVESVCRTTGRAVAAEFPAPKNWLMLSTLADGFAL